MIKKSFIPIAVICMVAVALLFVFKLVFKPSNELFSALFGGNMILYVATYYSFNFYLRAINNNNTHTFLRMVYLAMISKMLICIAAVLGYAFTFKPVSKAAILVFMGLYFVYTFAEVTIVMRLNKEKKNV